MYQQAGRAGAGRVNAGFFVRIVTAAVVATAT